MSVAENRIAYQGEKGAYSHLACHNVYPDMETLPCQSFEAAFEAVERGDANLAMIPIENTLGGRVAELHVLLPQTTLYIIGEHYQPVHHCLLGLAGASESDLTHVRSHPQGLAQCRKIIQELGLQPMQVADTAGGAREVRDLGDPAHAAIASKLAGETYDGLQVLRERVEDGANNTTRFIILSAEHRIPDISAGPCMTSMVFRVRSVPAALYKALGVFAERDINITKLESYITDEHFKVAQFYTEIEGHTADRKVMEAFEELDAYCSVLQVMGTYPANEFRRR
jgi:prephenate dehydratase